MTAAKNRQTISGIHYFMYSFNGLVIFLLAGFMSVTQAKINLSLAARSFLDPLSVVPWPAQKIFCLAVLSFLGLLGMSFLYRQDSLKESLWKYLILFLEIFFCVVVMRSINMAYDGVVLMVVADLVHGYQGKNQRVLLMFAMLGLYLIANYNLAALQMKMVPIEAYISYYNPAVQGVLKAACNIFTSFNLIIFVMYMIMLVQSQQKEKERIKSLNAQLNAANEQLRVYAIEVERMAETRERNRLAREIHDTLGHALTGIAAGLDACLATIDAAPDFTKRQLQKIGDTARHGITDVRRSVKKLRPDGLEKLSLKAALQQMVEDFSAASGMRIELMGTGWPEHLREDEEEVIYRVVQEGITNANRHGHAAKIRIAITCEENGLQILLEDNGIGCSNVQPGFGLRHMQERLALLKGTLQCEGENGFIIKASIPMSRKESYDDKSVDCR
ncbi:signal transduction histidine kinase [Sporomusaceae bacterium BoRhaA]|uniref:sensor histidine kinase n=1 Tax=Pelorhabdus rhamnosifermentans TaxID=2772457 RepID=UPI001C0605D2|nr:sensor histidine kinase [Pelorhabdus rhamnosifermentans]MBU2701374.1 signal transduction histidine kinase [Pelorhabdus rhamnosifermentans]